MTKRRAIYGSAATSISLARCCPEAQLLFDRLISQADDQGRLQGDPMLVKAACMPLIDRATTRTVERWLAELTEYGMILRYEAEGQLLIQIVKWWEHQDWMRHIYPSRWLPPNGWRHDRTKGSGERQDAADSRPNVGEVPPDNGAAPAQSEVRVVSESVDVLETNSSRDSDESSLPPPTDFAIRQVTGTHFDLTRERPNEKAIAMYSDLIDRFGVETVRAAQYAVGPSKAYGFVGRVKAECKRRAA